MIVSPAWRGKRYAVLGLARSGAASVRALVAGGASVVAWDSDEARRTLDLPELARGGGPSRSDGGGAGREGPSTTRLKPSGPPPQAELGEEFTIADLDTIDLAGVDALVVSPGVPLNTHPLAAKAQAAGIPIIGDIELFAEARASLPPHKVVGVTGTNGKSTVTALIHHILQTAGAPSLMGGNIGLPILAQEPLPEGGVYVLELSSYQIDLTHSLDCDVAVLTNITPDHLDRYEGFEAYVASKMRLFAMQSDGHPAFTAEPDVPDPWGPAKAGTQSGLPPSREHRLVRVAAISEGQAAWPSLQGPHNARNVACAVAACRTIGVADDRIAEALRTFTGLPHRMERVATLNGVTYVDDSKATNPESAAPALAAYPQVHWIVGGRAKGDDLDACAAYYGHVVRAYAIGEAGPRFAAVLRAAGVSVADCGTLEVAVNAAWSAARRGETVLLSPACASFDQFADYAARGLAFRRAVEALPVKEAPLVEEAP